MNFNYKDVLPIESYKRTVWFITDTSLTETRYFVTVWHEEAKIEDVVESYRNTQGVREFTVQPFDVGTLKIIGIEHSMMNGRKVNQDMMVVV